MNAFDLAQRAYGETATPVRTDRSTEYAAFTKVTRSLMQAVSAEQPAIPATARAIYENRRLWSVLAADVAHGQNALPDTLRAQIFYLHEFVDQHSRKVLKGKASAKVLIEINAAIMRGLGQEGGQK